MKRAPLWLIVKSSVSHDVILTFNPAQPNLSLYCHTTLPHAHVDFA